jgi:alpha-L-fucosidase
VGTAFFDAGANLQAGLEHHDGFSMWDSDVNEWNSVDKV